MRLALPVTLAALLLALAGCGDDTKTVTELKIPSTGTTVKAQTQRLSAIPPGNHGPHYFETPSHNIGCYIDSKSARCDIRERSWSPPPKPQYCVKVGVDWGQGLAVGAHRASFVCAGDTVLGGPGLLGYRHSAQRGTTLCVSRVAGITCRNTETAHGFFLSRASYRLF